MKSSRSSLQPAGFSLVVSLIILTLLAVMVTGFLSSTALDRATARAFAGKSQAEIAAETGVNQAISLLRETIAQYPDSATYWETLTPGAGGSDVEGTMLYYYDLPPPTGYDTTASAAQQRIRWMLPLMSRGVDTNGVPLGPVKVSDKGTALGTDSWHDDFWQTNPKDKTTQEPNCINLNRRRSNDDSDGWIGSPPRDKSSNPPPRPFRAKWINVKENNNPTGKTIARYAFWVEDESFKLNLNLLGNTPRADEKKTLDSNTLNNRIAELPIQGLLRSTGVQSQSERDSVALGAKDLREKIFGKRLTDLRSFNQVAIQYTGLDGKKSDRLGDDTKFLATIYSSALNVSRQGSQRLNLNVLGFGGLGGAPEKNGSSDVQNQLYEIIETIRYHAPKFGQRFYRKEDEIANWQIIPALTAKEMLRRNTELVSDVHQNIYLHKVAANIRDYIDLDWKPTIIQGPNPPSPDAKVHAKVWDYSAPPTGHPTNTAMSTEEGGNESWTQGKEPVPFLQEAVARYRGGPTTVTVVASGQPSPAPPTRWELKVDYYLEFWNMTSQPIDMVADKDKMGTNPFVRIADQVGWREQLKSGTGQPLIADNAPAGNPSEAAEFVMYLTDPGYPDPNSKTKIVNQGKNVPGVVFKAGGCTVITSDPDAGTTKGLAGVNPVNLFYVANLSAKTKREFKGAYRATNGLGIIQIVRDTSSSDYGTEVILGSDSGYLESHPYAVSMASPEGLKNPDPMEKVYGGSLYGNTSTSPTPSQLGDPRTNNEQISIKRYQSQSGVIPEADQTRFFNINTNTLGWPNSDFVNPQTTPNKWKDYYKGWEKTGNPQDLVADPAFVANGPLTSIGQLGDIFDPARIQGTVGALKDTSPYVYSRGGGRTFKIGQPDDLVDTVSATAASRAWASWRLCDFFTDTSDLKQPGLININGLARDNGAALRAAYEGMTIQGAARGPSDLKQKSGTDWLLKPELDAAAGLQPLVLAALDRMTRNDPAKTNYDATKAYFGPFTERGELSDLTTYTTGSKLLSDGSGAAIDMATTFDRTREAVLRRLVDFTTTRGSVFSVYAVGESITEEKGTRAQRVTGRHQVKVTFQLVPKTATGTDFGVPQQDFNPEDPNSIKQRFSKPDHYDIQILQVSS